LTSRPPELLSFYPAINTTCVVTGRTVNKHLDAPAQGRVQRQLETRLDPFKTKGESPSG
jgi:hypothetical protein